MRQFEVEKMRTIKIIYHTKGISSVDQTVFNTTVKAQYSLNSWWHRFVKVVVK